MNKHEVIKKLAKIEGAISTTQVAKVLKISRQMANRYLNELVQKNTLYKTGSTRSARYSLGLPKSDILKHLILVKKNQNLQEDQVYLELEAKLQLKTQLNKSASRIAYYAFSEMLNNAIDHSDSKNIRIEVEIKNGNFEFKVKDSGIGIYNRIMKGFKLRDDYEAIEHLFKGKQTTMPERHSGQGIFFTSRIADRFEIKSNSLTVVIDNSKEDQLIKLSKKIKGTEVHFQVKAKTKKNLEALFKEYANDDYEFDRNTVRVKLSNYKELISRSQARRLLMGLDKFDKIIFDFKNVKGIGQAYADEIFRVFQKMNPRIKIEYANAEKPIEFMIKRSLKP